MPKQRTIKKEKGSGIQVRVLTRKDPYLYYHRKLKLLVFLGHHLDLAIQMVNL